MADEDFYSDGSESSEPATTETTTKPDAGEEHTALLPKSFFGSKELEPGKRCQVEIEKVYGDEVQVSYVPPTSKSEPPKETAPAPEPDSMASMMED